MATLGSTSPMKVLKELADAMAISESSSEVGAMFRPQSANMSVPSAPNCSVCVHMIMKAETSLVPGAVFRICRAGRRVSAVRCV